MPPGPPHHVTSLHAHTMYSDTQNI